MLTNKNDEIKKRFKIGQLYSCRHLYYFCYEQMIIPDTSQQTSMSSYNMLCFVEKRKNILIENFGVGISIIEPGEPFMVVELPVHSYSVEMSIKVLHKETTGYIFPFVRTSEGNVLEVYPIEK